MISINDLATYRVRPMADIQYDSRAGEYAMPRFELIHSICNIIVSSYDTSVSLVEMVQHALNHNKECSWSQSLK